MSYKQVEINEIDRVMEIIEDGRALLKLEGNGQWQFGYPNRNDLINDINNKNLYGVYTKDNVLVCVAAFTFYEEDYNNPYEGAWLTDSKYMVLHRIAIKEEYRGKGYAKEMFKVFEEVAKELSIHSLRVDTHEKNNIMVNLLKSCGFIAVGKAILKPNKDRVLFEKLI